MFVYVSQDFRMATPHAALRTGLTLEQAVSRHIADLLHVGNDEEATRLTMQGPIETAKSIEDMLGRLGKDLVGLSRILAGVEGMEPALQGAISALQRSRLRYRTHLKDMLERRRADQFKTTLAIFVLPEKSKATKS